MRNSFKSSFQNIDSLNAAEKKLFFGIPLNDNKRNVAHGPMAVSNIENEIIAAPLVESRQTVDNLDNDKDFDKLYSDKTPKNGWRKKLVIPWDNKIKNVWDTIILGFTAYSCITTAYFIAFEPELNKGLEIFESILQGSFAIDCALRFFHSYKDSSTQEIVDDVKDISIHYLKTWFIFDFISIIPLNFIPSTSNLTFTKLFRIVRIPRILKIIDSSKFDQLMDALLTISSRGQASNRQERMKIKYISRYIYKVLKLILIAIMLTYFIACFWYWITKQDFFDDGDMTFYNVNGLENFSLFRRLIICCYFSLTTLATVGYGDLVPTNNLEKVLGIFLMIVGIAFFSYIMGNFNDVLINYDKKMGIIDKGSDLQVWLTSLSKFTAQKPLPRKLVKKIDDHFKFFWKHDRLASLTADDQYLTLMPLNLRTELINHLFDDVYQLFRGFLMKRDFPDANNFYYHLSFAFLPRKFENNETIFSQGDEVYEIYFILDGELRLGFNTSNGPVYRYFSKGFYFGDYNVLFNKPLDYDFFVTSTVKCLALPKERFLELVDKERHIRERMISSSIKNSLETAKAFQKSLKEKMIADGEEPTTEAVMLEFNKNVKDKVKRIIEEKEKNKKNNGGKNKLQTENHPENHPENHLESHTENVIEHATLLNKEVEEELNKISRKLEDLKNNIGQEFLKS